MYYPSLGAGGHARPSQLLDRCLVLRQEPMLDCHLVQRKEPMLNRRRIIDLALPRGIIVQQHRNKKQI
ncbi:hypothetical protein PC116_g25463 [Phytophthora cactorum]|nr:hypothetical protein Pcac1_g27220 [Phytophthora cactorum]KAG2876367.1 hypothetical protein PC114_g24229 [Phytophthora cactorum]KAG2979611.1 hypothetical protein PC120_g25112 [Phytophthora cactorum]KAG3128600.1 hypothetical protein C6341_g24484 [Phytophthora cactorum]KAG3137074.1 hypothetical protein PC128_g25805 [Phytophthora cactorum]